MTAETKHEAVTTLWDAYIYLGVQKAIHLEKISALWDALSILLDALEEVEA